MKPHKNSSEQPLVIMAVGDPAGVGPEIALKSFTQLEGSSPGSPVPGETGKVLVAGDASILAEVRDRLDIPVEISLVDGPEEAKGLSSLSPGGLPLVPVLDLGVVKDKEDIVPGKIQALGGRSAYRAAETAVALCLEGRADGMVTGPLHKGALKEAGYSAIGYTEMIAELVSGAASCGPRDTSAGSSGVLPDTTASRAPAGMVEHIAKGITMFQVGKMRVFFYSRHVSLRQAIDLITREGLTEIIEASLFCLSSLGIADPSLAVAGLNPHASDNGLFGSEEGDIIRPAVDDACRKGHRVYGPLPADSVFQQAAEGRFNGVVSLFHDQGHIAAKCYDFYRVVSVTFGYPFIRTSVDHGTAFDIAWQGKANPLSMSEAAKTALGVCKRYQSFCSGYFQRPIPPKSTTLV